jgi:hypothetical protein
MVNPEFPEAWKEEIIYHPVQAAMVADKVRFKVVPAGRRSGKTFHAKRILTLDAMQQPGQYFACAPTYGQAKKIFFKDIGNLIPSWFVAKESSKTELTHYLKNGSEICVIGLDKPARFEGVPWTGGVIDEIADIKETAWAENIRPALDTIGLNTWCILTGVPDGLGFYYDLYNYAISGNDPEWKGYHWKSADILSSKVIDAAKRQLSSRQFRQEYEGSFETASGRVYEDYSNENHTNKTFNSDLGHILWCHDFNFTPLSSAICQREGQRVGDTIYVVDEIILASAVAKQTALEFVDKFKDHKHCIVRIFGDASGRQGEKHGHKSDWIIIEEILRKAGFRVDMQVPRSNGPIKDGQNSLRGRIMNAAGERSFFVNPAKAKYADKALATVQLKKGSTFQEEDSDYQHIGTAMRYMTGRLFPTKFKKKPTQKYWK